MKLDFERRTLRFAQPMQTSYGPLKRRELILVSLTGEDGVAGYGEAAPLEPYDGIGIERVQAALESYAPLLAASRGLNGAQLIDACSRVDDLPQALAAIDLALWDRAGRIGEQPIAALITDDPASSVPVNAAITAVDRVDVAEQVTAALTAGYECIKLKVGLGDDAGRVAAARAAGGRQMTLRLDANGAWDVGQAVSAIHTLAPAGLELVEEPVHGLQRVREVRERVAVRVAIDETAAEHGALGAGVADAVCLKISRCGGIGGLIAAATLVRASGAEAYVASTFDGPLGIAAGIHAAAALASRGPMPYCGLATLGMFADSENPFPVHAGALVTPRAPGLGVEPL